MLQPLADTFLEALDGALADQTDTALAKPLHPHLEQNEKSSKNLVRKDRLNSATMSY